MDKGKKIRCKKCDGHFYDLNGKILACPKCSGTISRSSNPKIKSQRLYQNEEEQPSLAMQLLKVPGASSALASTIDAESVELPAGNHKEGWYAVISNEIKNNKIDNNYSLLHLGSSPLSGLQSYLATSRFKGVGIKKAKSLVAEYEENLFFILEGSVSSIQEELQVTAEQASDIHDGWHKAKDENYFNIITSEFNFLEMQKKKIASLMGANLITHINRNPFFLVKVLPNFSIEDVDRLCRRLDIPITTEQRVVASADIYLSEAEKKSNHTCIPTKYVYKDLSKTLSIKREKIEKILLENAGDLYFSKRKKQEVLSTNNSMERDVKVTRLIKSIIDRHQPVSQKQSLKTEDIDTTEGILLSDEQLAAINNVTHTPIAVITGGPGAGKTTMVQGLVNFLREIGADVRLCAPTGKAAKRIAETPGLSELSPSTIHMFLAKASSSKKQLEFDVMIVDEASMIDVDLLVLLLEAIPDGASVIFIGDVDQLPPVGAGQPFRDLIEADTISISRLTGNFRQSSFSDTVKAARQVISGKQPQLVGSLSESDFVFVECPSQDQAEQILNYYFDLLPAKLSVAPQDIQILAPQRTGDVGVFRLNQLVQRRITSGSKVLFSKKSGNQEVDFYVGDKVIQRKNNYELKVMNGDQGVITRMSGGEIIVEFDGREVSFDAKQRYDLELAYATTIHSSQGSEYPGVIIPIVSAHSHMLSRNLIYTAITRGKRQVCLIGEAEALSKAIEQFAKDFRWTGLTERLVEELR